MAYELFLDSFDTDASAGRWALALDLYASIAVPSTGNGRHGSSSARIGAYFPGGYGGYRAPYFTASTHITAGVAFRTNGNVVAALLFQPNNTTGADSVLVSVDSDRLIKWRIGYGGATTSTGVVADASAWYYLECGVVVSSSGALTIKLNGNTIANITGVDTRPLGVATINSVGLFSYHPSTDFDDFYVAYGDELKWLGDIRVDALALTANATPQDWTPDTGNAWERLNADAGTITGTDVGDKSLFEIADFTPATSAIHAVQLTAKGRKTDAGSRSMALVIKSDATEDVGPDLALSDSTLTYTRTFETDPDTSGAWTDAALDALQVGVKVSA